MWLKANNNPRYISSFYVQCVREVGGKQPCARALDVSCITCVFRLPTNPEDRCWDRKQFGGHYSANAPS